MSGARARAGAGLLAALWLAACAESGWDASGVVRSIRPDEGLVQIEHGDIEDLMPAMTMDFEVVDPALLDGLEVGHFVEFRLVRSETGFRIADLSVPAAGSSGVGGGMTEPADPLLGDSEPAPDFDLIDQRGEPLALESLRGGPVVLDFIFTRCAGPCPILTGLLADVREALEPEARERVRFVSISLDPEYDTPERLLEYARARRVDAPGWSFLTGPRERVDAVVRAYGVGSTPDPEGGVQLVHTLVTFLIDSEGRIAGRYLGLRHPPESIAGDIAELL